ncbi:MAG: MBL fold metallo-hydrolase [Oscillospiraceae bacterium]|jgi:glyoxylase-like metal-dependent hydrolase (beta-lactamase superfamily II)|nr:MBL fold metallo-hydrolase [Oscillospiraceae bacterium]
MGILKAHQIFDNTYLLAEEAGPALVTMALLIGSDRAILIDSGCGITGTLPAFVRKQTDKPILHLITHCDPDHAGASALFADIHMSSADDDLKAMALPYAQREGDILHALDSKPLLQKIVRFYLRRHMVKAEDFTYTDIRDGEEFLLSEQAGAYRQIEAFAMPGHTKGSMCFADKTNRIVFAGDSIAIRGNAVVGADRCAPLSVFRNALVRFAAKGFADYTIYTGHEYEPLPPGTVEELLSACNEILAGQTQADKPGVPYFADQTNPTGMMYHKHNAIGVFYQPKNL